MRISMRHQPNLEWPRVPTCVECWIVVSGNSQSKDKWSGTLRATLKSRHLLWHAVKVGRVWWGGFVPQAHFATSSVFCIICSFPLYKNAYFSFMIIQTDLE